MSLSLWRTDYRETRIAQAKTEARTQVKSPFKYQSREIMVAWFHDQQKWWGWWNLEYSLIDSIFHTLDVGCAWNAGCRKKGSQGECLTITYDMLSETDSYTNMIICMHPKKLTLYQDL